jgi:hypothetical protein
MARLIVICFSVTVQGGVQAVCTEYRINRPARQIAASPPGRNYRSYRCALAA